MDTTPALLSSKVKPIKEGRNVLSGEEQGETAVFASYTKGVFLSVNPKTDFRSKKGFRVPFGKSKSGFLIW